MTDAAWREANQQYLMAAVAVVSARLIAHAARSQQRATLSFVECFQELWLEPDETLSRKLAAGMEPSPDPDEQALEDARRQLSAPPALDVLCAAFDLSPFERDILLLCAGVELDSSFAGLCAAAHGDPRRPYPTFSLALSALPDAHWSALTPARPLRYYDLIELGEGTVLTLRALRINERALHSLTGISYLERDLAGMMKRMSPTGGAQPLLVENLTQRIEELWSPKPKTWPMVQLCGEDLTQIKAIAAAACARRGLKLYLIHGMDIPAQPVERNRIAQKWEREAFLIGGVLLLDCEMPGNTKSYDPALELAERVAGRVMLISKIPLSQRQRPVELFKVP
jgi:hypothetical protein